MLLRGNNRADFLVFTPTFTTTSSIVCYAEVCNLSLSVCMNAQCLAEAYSSFNTVWLERVRSWLCVPLLCRSRRRNLLPSSPPPPHFQCRATPKFAT